MGKKTDASGAACGEGVGRRKKTRRCATLGQVVIPRPHDSGAGDSMDWTH